MKTIFFVRHAKSSWTDPHLSDHDRPLNKRGLRDAPVMAEYLAKKYPEIDLFVSSSASRALKTARIFQKVGFPSTKLEIKSNLYHASSFEIVRVVKELNNDFQSVAIFGHNPGMTSAVNYFNDGYIDNVPTCGIGVVKAEIVNWAALTNESADLLNFFYPKMFK